MANISWRRVRAAARKDYRAPKKASCTTPTGIAITNGLIYVVDSGNDRVEVYNEEKGEAVNQWGEAGTTAGKFKTPLAIAVSPSGNVWVGDSLNRRLQEFKAEGKFIEAVGWGVIKNSESQIPGLHQPTGCEAGLKGEGEGEFASTWGMAFAGSNLYVSDTGNNRVEEINEKSEAGRPLRQRWERQRAARSPDRHCDQPHHRQSIRHRHGEQSYAGVHAVRENTSRSSGLSGLAMLSWTSPRASRSTPLAKSMSWMISTIGCSDGHRRSRATKAPMTPRTVYYTAKEEAEVAECRNHPEWADLPCQTGPVAQPGTGPPNYP